MLTAQLGDTGLGCDGDSPGIFGSHHILLLMLDDSCPGGPSRGSGPRVWEGALTHKCDSVGVSGWMSFAAGMP